MGLRRGKSLREILSILKNLKSFHRFLKPRYCTASKAHFLTLSPWKPGKVKRIVRAESQSRRAPFILGIPLPRITRLHPVSFPPSTPVPPHDSFSPTQGGLHAPAPDTSVLFTSPSASPRPPCRSPGYLPLRLRSLNRPSPGIVLPPASLLTVGPALSKVESAFRRAPPTPRSSIGPCP